MNKFKLGNSTFEVKGNITPFVKEGVLSYNWDIFSRNEKETIDLNAVGSDMYDIFIEDKGKFINLIEGVEYKDAVRFKDTNCIDAFVPEDISLQPLYAYSNSTAREVILSTDKEYNLILRTWSVEERITQIMNNTRSISVGDFVQTITTEDKPDTLTGIVKIKVAFKQEESLTNFFNN